MDELQFCISTLPSCQTCPKGIAQFFRKNSAHSVSTPFKFLDFSNWSPYQCQNVSTCGISTLMKESFNGTRVQWNIQNPTKWATFSQTIKFMVRPPKTSKCTEFREALTCKKIIGFRHMIYLINQRFWQIEQDSGHQAPEEYSYSTPCHELPYQTSYIVLVHRYSHFFASKALPIEKCCCLRDLSRANFSSYSPLWTMWLHCFIHYQLENMVSMYLFVYKDFLCRRVEYSERTKQSRLHWRKFSSSMELYYAHCEK